MPKKKTTITDEIELAATNYEAGIDNLPVVHESRDLTALVRAAAKHAVKINEGEYGFDTLLLESAYRGLSADNADDARGSLIDVAAIAATIVAIIDAESIAEPEWQDIEVESPAKDDTTTEDE